MKRVLLLSLVVFGAASCVVDRPPCTPQNCPGCCDEADVCHQGDRVDFCGLQGGACLNCSPSVCKANGECFELQDFLDSGTPDANFFVYEPDASIATDAGQSDAGVSDAGPGDAGLTDAGPGDAGLLDAGLLDAGAPTDAGTVTDAGRPDAGTMDGGVLDAGRPDAGAFDAGVLDAGRPDAGGPVDAGCLPVDKWVDPVNGLDTNSGTQASPYRSVRRAAMATTCGTIWLEDGIYGPDEGSTSPIVLGALNATLTVRAVHPRMAIWGTGNTTAPFRPLAVQRGTVTFQDFECFVPNCFNFQALAAANVTLRGVTFRGLRDVNWSWMVFANSVGGPLRITVEPDGVPSYCLPGPTMNDRVGGWIELRGDTHLTINGGACDGFGFANQPASLLGVLDPAARLFLNSVTLRGAPAAMFANSPVAFVDLIRGEATIVDSLLEATAGNRHVLGVRLGLEQSLTAAPRLTLTNSTVRGMSSPTADAAHAVWLDRLGQNDQGHVFVTITGGALENCRGGVLLRSGIGGTAHLTMTGTAVRNMLEPGVRIAQFTSSDVAIDGVTFENNERGLSLLGPAAAHQLRVRSSTFTSNSITGAYLEGGAAAVFDLGTLTSPGNNVFSGTSTAHLSATTGAMPIVFAVGNTWAPNQQGADAMGQYVAMGNGGVLEFVGPTSGQNVRAANAGARVRVAENP
ncbi:MAG: DUF1565 domain-containing protein [Myxococcaceae bacterium]|nr:DUF1565 domain-containing protein [Myxococcaceae bacterium]